jgi:hypothetical protein
VSVLPGIGSGDFAPRIDLPAPGSPGPVAICDLNGDGTADLAFADLQAATVSVIPGNGNGTFGAKRSFSNGGASISLAAGDGNGDGRPDLASACPGCQAISVHLGEGDGTIFPTTSFPAGRAPSAVAIGDLDGDGVPDLAVANNDYAAGGVSLLKGHGDGTLELRASIATGTYPRSVAIGDLNHDGRPDVVVTHYLSHTVSVLLGQGGWTFGPPASYATGSFPVGVRVADLNGDGHPDLAIADYLAIPSNYYASDVSVLLGHGDGTFAASQEYSAGSAPWGIAVGDLNGDGKLDLVTANLLSGVSVLLGNGNGTFAANVDYAAPYGESRLVEIGDLNLDGRPDVVTFNGTNGTLGVYLGNGNGTLGPRADTNIARAGGGLALADFNGDGILDLVTANGGCNTSTVLLGRGDGTFGRQAEYDYGSGSGALAVADMNGDGRPDVVVADAQANAVCVLNTVGGGLPTAVTVSLMTSEATADHARIEWYWAGGNGASATVYRRTGTTAWVAVGTVTADGTGKMALVDRAVTPGTKYGYRLGVSRDANAPAYLGETWLTIPVTVELALRGFQPNPAGEDVSVAFALAGSGPARLDVFDVHGRRVATRDVGTMGAGAHVVRLQSAARLVPGVYLLRLSLPGQTLTTRGVIMSR